VGYGNVKIWRPYRFRDGAQGSQSILLLQTADGLTHSLQFSVMCRGTEAAFCILREPITLFLLRIMVGQMGQAKNVNSGTLAWPARDRYGVGRMLVAFARP
jgi:hypothetical protein